MPVNTRKKRTAEGTESKTELRQYKADKHPAEHPYRKQFLFLHPHTHGNILCEIFDFSTNQFTLILLIPSRITITAPAATAISCTGWFTGS